ncbi:hypothetical protein GBA52_010470 [Prunus armeniaca]|nr:hypothetical protein GBA52_010470 [Prunus armeniaca]
MHRVTSPKVSSPPQVPKTIEYLHSRRGFADGGEKEVDGVKEEAHDTDDEDVVPKGHVFESQFKDLVPLRVLLSELGRVEKLWMPVEAAKYGWNV